MEEAKSQKWLKSSLKSQLINYQTDNGTKDIKIYKDQQKFLTDLTLKLVNAKKI